MRHLGQQRVVAHHERLVDGDADVVRVVVDFRRRDGDIDLRRLGLTCAR
jgi:hypothetical protein